MNPTVHLWGRVGPLLRCFALGGQAMVGGNPGQGHGLCDCQAVSGVVGFERSVLGRRCYARLLDAGLPARGRRQDQLRTAIMRERWGSALSRWP